MKKMKEMFEIVKNRYSVRNYSSKPIGDDVLQKIKAFLTENRKGPLGSEVRFEVIDATEYEQAELKKLGTYGMIKGSKVFLSGLVQQGKNSMEDFGYCMEKNILFATSLGLGTCWLGGALNRSTFAVKMNASDSEILPAVSPIGYAGDKRTMMENFIRLAVGAHKRKDPAELFFDGSLEIPLDYGSCLQYSDALEAVRSAPSASNKQPWRILKDSSSVYHFFLKENAAYNNMIQGIKLQNVDIGIAMCHFELVAKESGLNGFWEYRMPALERGELKYIISWVEEDQKHD